MADEPRTTRTENSGGRGSDIVVALIVLAAIFILQNTQEVKVTFFFSTTTIPLIFGASVSRRCSAS